MTPNGLRFSRPRAVVPKTGGGKRGKVKGFSRMSARRLRGTLFRCDFHPKDMGVVGVCLTLPPEAEPGVGESVWKQIQTHKDSIPGLVSAVWRKEVQKKGREHYHVVVWSDDPYSLRTVGALVRLWCRLVSKRCPHPNSAERRMVWAHCRSNVSFFDAEPENPSSLSTSEREAGFEKLVAYLPCLTLIDSRGQGVRYLIEHSSRHKAYQAKVTGRAWGVWNRKRLPRVPPDASCHARLSRTEEVGLSRFLRKLSRYPIPAPCVFGWKWSRGRRFGGGTHIVPSATTRDAVQRWLGEQGIEPDVLGYMGSYSSKSTVMPSAPTIQTDPI